MKYVVLCHTQTVDRSRRDRNGERHVTIGTHCMLQCVNRRDAELMVSILSKDDAELTDGPFIVSRAYEVGVWVFTPKGKVTLTLSDVEMIAVEYSQPTARAAE